MYQVDFEINSESSERARCVRDTCEMCARYVRDTCEIKHEGLRELLNMQRIALNGLGGVPS